MVISTAPHLSIFLERTVFCLRAEAAVKGIQKDVTLLEVFYDAGLSGTDHAVAIHMTGILAAMGSY